MTKTTTNTKTNISALALMLTAYERYGTVDRDDFIRLLADELTVDESMISEYCEYLSDNDDYDNMPMSWDEVEDYINSLSPVDAFNLGQFSNFSYGDDYYRFNGYGNIESINTYSLVKEIAEDTDFCRWYVENYILDDYDEEDIDAIITEANDLIRQGY